MKMLMRFAAIVICGLMAGKSVASAPPENTATVFVHGFNVQGTSISGTVGADYNLGYAMNFAVAAGLPTALSDPTAPNQVAATTYYGNQYPNYYTADDIAEVNAAGEGVPRYALISAKYARHVMERSGATQVSLVGVSFGALVTRYIIEKNLEQLASSYRISRWIGVEGVVAGNYAATYGGIVTQFFFDQYFDGVPIDLEHMKYGWVRGNLNDPYYSSSSRWLASFPTHFWLGAHDDLLGDDGTRFVTDMSGKANDGLVLMEDGVLRNLPANLLYEGRVPTESVLHANHFGLTSNPGFQVGLAAQLLGRTRATVTLSEVEVLREFDGGNLGNGEYVFGVQVFSPLAGELGVTVPVQDLRAEDRSLPFARLSVGSRYVLNQVWYDDIVLPGETQLRLQSNVHEIDGDVVYQVTEVGGKVHQPLANAQTFVDITKNGTYPIATDDWRGTVKVEVHQYPDFRDPAAAADWTLYE